MPDKIGARDTGAIIILWLLLLFCDRRELDGLKDSVKEPRDIERDGRLGFGDI